MRNRIFLALGLCATIGATPARAGNLGVANGYTEFSFGNSNRSSYTDSTGAVAVGGNATFNNFSIGASLPGGGSGYGLVVGGTLEGSQTNINGGGNASYAAIANGTHLYFNNGGTAIQQPSPINFSSAETYLTGLSSTLANTAANGTTGFQYGGLTLTANSNTSTLDVFNVSGADLSSANGLKLMNVSSSATVVINVDGTSDTMANFGINLNGVPGTQVLFNFESATSLDISSFGMTGSILAPKATIEFDNGQIYGTVIGNQINGNGQTDYDPFTPNNLPNPVPEPSSIVMMATAAALGLIMIFARRRMRTSYRTA